MQHSIGRRPLLAAAGAALAFPAIRAHAQTAGVALVIGNSKYQWEAPLPNVRRDAPDIAKRFQALGLKTELVQDAGRDAMRRAIDAFLASARGANFAAVYFAGHGASWRAATYLVPVDADLTNPDTRDNLIQVEPIRNGMDAASNRLFVFDNCRNNPADGWQQREADAAAVMLDSHYRNLTPNSLLMFSTAPGRIALDGPPGENSPFAAALLRQLEGGSVDLQSLAGTLRRDLLIATQGRQLLFDRNTYAAPFLLKGPPAKVAANRSAWASDPSKLVEIPNAFAFAQQNGLPLPAGLVVHRPPAGSPHGQKVGAFKFDMLARGGGTEPGVLVVISVEEKEGAEVVYSTRLGGDGFWRFPRVSLSGDGLEMAGSQGTLAFKWSDANSGGFSFKLFNPRRNTTGYFSSRFTRLDG
jgi:hypothetical protein